MLDGRILDPIALGSALRQLLARTEINATRALIAASDTIASFKVLAFPGGTADADLDAVVRTQLPTGPERLAVRRTEVIGRRPERIVYAAAWDREQVRAISETARHAGVEPAVVDLKSLCVARTVPQRACLVLDLTSEPFEVVLIDDHIPRVWHSFHTGPDGDLAMALAAGLKPVLGYYRNSASSVFTAEAPILIRSEQVLPSLMATRLRAATGHPVDVLPQPPRVDPDLRYMAFLVCIGLVMRRQA
jgi:hypothetical protein